MTILCATQFSESSASASASASAVAVAALLAERSSQRLWLTSVLPHVAVGPNDPKEQAVDAALHLEAGALREQGVEVETAVLHGPVQNAVARLCEDVAAELVVVGDAGHTRSFRLTTSVDRLAIGTSVPLLVVRSQKPFEAWAKEGRPLKVLLAVDHAWTAGPAREWLSRMASFGPLDVVGAHVWAPEGQAQIAMAASLTKELEDLLAGLPANVTSRVTLEIGRGRVGAAVLALAARERADVLVLGTHAHKGLLGRLKSVEHEVLVDSLMSVALVPEAPGEAIARAPALWPEEQTLFVQQRRGVLSLTAGAAVVVAALIGTGVLLRVYRDGASQLQGTSCRLVCQ